MIHPPPLEPMWLVPLFGPALNPVQLAAKEAGLLLGRQEQCDVRLRSDQVSRQHARLTFDGSQWRLRDLMSRWGTFVNGVRLSPENDTPLREGDLIRISPWTFSLSRAAVRHGGVESFNDAQQTQTLVKAIETQQASIAADLLGLVLESAAGMHAAESEKAMAEVLMDAAVRGTGLPNAAVLRPLDAAGRVEVIASRRALAAEEAGALFSRSLLSLASTGVVAQLSASAPMMSTSESIVQMNIDAAICVPLMLGTTVAAYLYLDSRGLRGANRFVSPQPIPPSAGAFCLALGRMAALALANLKRLDMERRQAVVMADIAAGAEAQRWILPTRQQNLGPLEYIGESRPGRFVAGDFFDVIPLGDSRVAVTLGDVSGKGVAASVLMSAAQGFLQGALRSHGDVERAVTEVNRYVCPRKPEGKFITMWVGVVDVAERSVRYVDAGHGYASLLRGDGSVLPLDKGEGLPVGVELETAYRAVTEPMDEGSLLLLVSDGFVEQFDPQRTAQFGMNGVHAALGSVTAGGDPVAVLFDAVWRHAASQDLADDATAVVIRRGGS